MFEKTESRGEDAAGIWGTQAGLDGGIIYHKEPVKSTEFVKSSMWSKIKKFNPNLLICHARAASQGSGSPSINKNNHPFASSDKSIGLIHNGLIKDSEYTALKRKYSVTSQCDSEMFLRVFEHERETGSLNGIKKIWSYMSRSHMALAIGEWLPEGRRNLWLLRNEYRSIWLADLRGLLGQVFFFSTPDIWDDAAANCKIGNDYLRRVKLIEVQGEEVWGFDIDVKNPVPYNDRLKKFTLDKGEYKNWIFDDKLVSVIKQKPVSKLLTRLDENEEPIEPIKKSAPFQSPKSWPYKNNLERKQDDILFPSTANKDKSLSTLEHLCSEIRRIIDDIETTAEELIENESITDTNLAELFSSLEASGLDLDGTGRILENSH